MKARLSQTDLFVLHANGVLRMHSFKRALARSSHQNEACAQQAFDVRCSMWESKKNRTSFARMPFVVP